MREFDLIVIGGGSGGVRAARMAATYGAHVALIEESRLGGTCVIRGCVPKKLYKYAAEFSGYFDVAESFGWNVQASFDWQTLRENKEKEITRLENIYNHILTGSKVEVFADRATLAGENQVQLQNSGETLGAKKILIATGGGPFMPEIPGIEHAITSNEAFDLPHLPKRALVVGGGFIAVEFASIFNGLGVDTVLSYRGAQILRGFDDHLREGLAEEMEHHGIQMCVGIQPLAITKTSDGLVVTSSDETEETFDQVLYATGRAPNTQGLGLEDLGIEMGRKGEIKVNAYSQTNIPSIYAVGDVTNRANLTPVAIREGAAFAETEFNDNPTTVDHSIIPTAVFSTPEIGTVGLTEAEAAAQYEEINVYVARFKPMIYSFTQTESRITIKLVTDANTDKVLGVHLMGSGAGEMVQMIGVAVTMGATKADLNRTIAVHPTAAEELVTLKEPTYRMVDGERI